MYFKGGQIAKTGVFHHFMCKFQVLCEHIAFRLLARHLSHP